MIILQISNNEIEAYKHYIRGSKSQNIKEYENQIKQEHKKLRKRLDKLINKINKLKEQGEIETEKADPVKDSPRYRAAVDLAGELSRLWFINQVHLFGSVAKGADNDESDIDMLINIVPKKRSAYLDRILTSLKHEIIDMYFPGKNTEFIELKKLNNSFFKKAGFLEASMLLGNEEFLTLNFDNGIYNIEKTGLIQYYIDGIATKYGRSIMQHLLYPGENTEYRAVIVIYKTPVFLIDYNVITQDDRYRADIKSIDINSTELKSFEMPGDNEFIASLFAGNMKKLMDKVMKDNIVTFDDEAISRCLSPTY